MKAPVPLNLETLYGDRFRIFTSEDYPGSGPVDPYDMELRGPGGAKVWPFGPTLLCAYVQGRIRKGRLLELGKPFQVGDDEAVIRFKPECFEPIAKYLGLYVRRHLGEERRAAAVETLRKAREAA